MTVTLKRHADFRRFLTDPNARITIIEDTNLADAAGPRRADAEARGDSMTRRVEILQTNALRFENPIDPEKSPSWLSWSGGTRNSPHDGDIVTVAHRARPAQAVRYRCSLAA